MVAIRGGVDMWGYKKITKEMVAEETEKLKAKNHYVTDGGAYIEKTFVLLPNVDLTIRKQPTFTGFRLSDSHQTFMAFNGDLTNRRFLSINASKVSYIKKFAEALLSFVDMVENKPLTSAE